MFFPSHAKAIKEYYRGIPLKRPHPATQLITEVLEPVFPGFSLHDAPWMTTVYLVVWGLSPIVEAAITASSWQFSGL